MGEHWSGQAQNFHISRAYLINNLPTLILIDMEHLKKTADESESTTEKTHRYLCMNKIEISQRIMNENTAITCHFRFQIHSLRIMKSYVLLIN